MSCKHCWPQMAPIDTSCPYCIIERQAGELEAMRVNDRRYRWLISQPATIIFDRELTFKPTETASTIYVRMIGNTELNRAIDQAIAAGEK